MVTHTLFCLCGLGWLLWVWLFVCWVCLLIICLFTQDYVCFVLSYVINCCIMLDLFGFNVWICIVWVDGCVYWLTFMVVCFVLELDVVWDACVSGFCFGWGFVVFYLVTGWCYFVIIYSGWLICVWWITFVVWFVGCLWLIVCFWLLHLLCFVWFCANWVSCVLHVVFALFCFGCV